MFLLSGLNIIDFKIPIDKDKISDELLSNLMDTIRLEKGRIDEKDLLLESLDNRAGKISTAGRYNPYPSVKADHDVLESKEAWKFKKSTRKQSAG